MTTDVQRCQVQRSGPAQQRVRAECGGAAVDGAFGPTSARRALLGRRADGRIDERGVAHQPGATDHLHPGEQLAATSAVPFEFGRQVEVESAVSHHRGEPGHLRPGATQLERPRPTRVARQDVDETMRAVGEVVTARHLARVPREAHVVGPDVRVRAVGGEVLVVERAHPPVAYRTPLVGAVGDVVTVQRLGAHHVAHGERPARFAREEAQSAAFEVPLHRGGQRVVVVGERATVGPHEFQRPRPVERLGARGSLDAVDHVAEEGREHDVVAPDRVGIGVEVAHQVQRVPVLPHPQIGVPCHHRFEGTGDLRRRIRQMVGGVQRHRPRQPVELVAQLGAAVELLAPVEAVERVVGLEREVVQPAEQFGVHVVERPTGGDPLGQLGGGEVLVDRRHHRDLASVRRLDAPHHEPQRGGSCCVEHHDGPSPRGAALDEDARCIGQSDGERTGGDPHQRDREVGADAPPEHEGHDHRDEGGDEQQRRGRVQEPAAREHHRRAGRDRRSATDREDQQRGDGLPDQQHGTEACEQTPARRADTRWRLGQQQGRVVGGGVSRAWWHRGGHDADPRAVAAAGSGGAS